MSRAKADGQWLVVPSNLSAWEAEVRTSSSVDAPTRRLLLAAAHLARRAMLRDGARVGDRFWVRADELAATARRLAP